MKVYIEREGREEELTFSGTAQELLDKLGVNAETVVITKNGTLITQEDEITNDDDIKLVSVVSGG